MAKEDVLSVSKLPALKVVSFRSRTQGDMFFLTDGEFRLGEAGKISASGEFGDNSKLRVEWSQVDVDPFLEEPWRSRLSGVLAGTASIEWPESGIAAGKAVGNFRLTDGVAENIEMLDQVATFTGAPQFRQDAAAGILRKLRMDTESPKNYQPGRRIEGALAVWKEHAPSRKGDGSMDRFASELPLKLFNGCRARASASSLSPRMATSGRTSESAARFKIPRKTSPPALQPPFATKPSIKAGA